MRLSDFECNSCQQVSEILYDQNSNDPVKCPLCQSLDVTKRIGAPRIVTGVRSLHTTTPTGMREVLKAIDKGTPAQFKGKPMSAL